MWSSRPGANSRVSCNVSAHVSNPRQLASRGLCACGCMCLHLPTKEERIRRLPVRWLSTAAQSEILAQRVLDSDHHSIALAGSGESVGRFGQLALLQVATQDEIFLLDVQSGGSEMLSCWAPVLSSTSLVKVLHDCRDLVSLLLNVHHLPIYSVFDLQVAYSAWLERENLEVYQAALAEVLRKFSLAYQMHRWDQLERHGETNVTERPLQPMALRRAVELVAHLLPLQGTLNKELGDLSGTLVQRRSLPYVDYAKMNLKLQELHSGAKLEAMLASTKPHMAYFKLNHRMMGVVPEEDLKEFMDLKPGDVAQCEVKSISPCQRFAYLQREGHGNLWFDRHQHRMLKLPDLDDRPQRQSSLYGVAQGAPPLREERRSFREPKAQVVHKLGKRGAVKVKKTGFTPPPQRR